MTEVLYTIERKAVQREYYDDGRGAAYGRGMVQGGDLNSAGGANVYEGKSN